MKLFNFLFLLVVFLFTTFILAIPEEDFENSMTEAQGPNYCAHCGSSSLDLERSEQSNPKIIEALVQSAKGVKDSKDSKESGKPKKEGLR